MIMLKDDFTIQKKIYKLLHEISHTELLTA